VDIDQKVTDQKMSRLRPSASCAGRGDEACAAQAAHHVL
jgi:hypothetical protein